MNSPETQFDLPEKPEANSELNQPVELTNVVYAGSVILSDMFKLGKDLLHCRSRKDVQDILGPPDYRL